MKQSKYSKEKRAGLIQDCENSGLSRAEWCRRNKIPYSRFVWWLRSTPSRQPIPNGFLQVQPQVAPQTTGPIEIRIKETIRITIPNLDTLERILPRLLSL